MNFKGKALAINSILILISTTLIGTMLHELAHFVTAEYFGLSPELHHNYVKTISENGTEIQNVLVAAAGPVFSLLLGVIVLYVSIKILKPSLVKLFTLWLGMGAILSFLGYILIAPFIKNGDTGKVFDYLGVPTSISIIIVIISFILINLIFSKLSKQFRFYKNGEDFGSKENSKQLFVYPIFSSILIVSLVNLPVTSWLSLLPTVFMPMTYFSTMGSYKDLNLKNADFKISQVSTILIIITIVSILLFRYLI